MPKGGGSLKVYKYYINIHYAACLAPIDAIKEVRFDDKIVYSGTFTGGTLSIDKEELYGGMDREGGVSGDMDIMFGAKTQTVNSFVAAKFPNPPAYKGVLSVILKDFYIGMNYYLKPFSIVASRIHATSSGATDWLPAYAEPITGQMNGVHIIRDLLTDTINGLGVSVSEIGTTFAVAAQTTFTEGYGFTFLFNDNKSIDDYIKIVKSHLNAEVYKDRKTGKYEIKLVREDYSIGSLFNLDTSNVKEITEFKRTLPGELFSKVIVQYVNGTTYQDAIEVLEDFTLSAKQGGAVEKTLEFKGCRTRSLAAKLCIRELAEMSTLVFVGQLTCNRTAEDLNIGDPFLLKASANPYLDVDLVCRVSAINLGSATDNKITIKFSQDIFSAQEGVIFSTPETAWVDVTTTPVPATNRLIQEIPYYLFAKYNGDVEAKNTATTISYLALAAAPPSNDSYLAGIWTNTVRRATLAFCPYAELVSSIDKLSTTITLKNYINLRLFKVGEFIQIDNELVGITAIASNIITVIRGCLDTVPESHSIDAKCYAWQSLNGSDKVQYLLTEVVAVRLTPRTPKAELAYASAPSNNITIIGRMHLPYPPGNFKINTLQWPSVITTSDLVLTWASRNRYQQTVSLLSYYAGNITTEASITYSGELRRVDTNAILLSFTGETLLTRTFDTLVTLAGTVSSLTNVGTTATMTMSTAHGLSSGRKVKVSGATPAAYNGTFIITVTSTTVFTYTMLSDPGSSASGTILPEASIYAGNVKVNLWSVSPNGNSFQTVSHSFTLE